MNDNIHSGTMRVHGPGLAQNRGVFRTFIETIDLATLYVSDGDIIRIFGRSHTKRKALNIIIK